MPKRAFGPVLDLGQQNPSTTTSGRSCASSVSGQSDLLPTRLGGVDMSRTKPFTFDRRVSP